MSGTRSPYVRRSMTAMLLACLLVAGGFRAVLADDSDLFKVRATPNVLLILDSSASMGWNSGGSEVGNLDGVSDTSRGMAAGASSRVDVGLKVLYELLNADNTVPQSGWPPYPVTNAGVDTETNSTDNGYKYNMNITTADEDKLKLRLGLLVYGLSGATYGPVYGTTYDLMKVPTAAATVSWPAYNMQINGTDNNLPPFNVSYRSVWRAIKQSWTPQDYTPMDKSLLAARDFMRKAVENDNSAACRKKYVILLTDGEDTIGAGTTGTYPTYYGAVGSDTCSTYQNGLGDEIGDPYYGKLDHFFADGNPPGAVTDNLAPTGVGRASCLSRGAGQKARDNLGVTNSKLLADNNIILFIVGLGMKDDGGKGAVAAADRPHLKVLRRVIQRMAQQAGTVLTDAEFRNVASGTDNADVSGGRAFFASNADELKNALTQAFATIIQDTESFTSPVVPSVRTTDNNKLYLCQFKPAVSPETFWEGFLKSYNLLDNGAISSYTPNWSADLRLNATNRVYSTNPRNVYTSRVSSGAWVRESFTTSNTWLDNNVLQVASATAKNNLIDNVIKRATQAKRLGDTYHSTPVLVGAPNLFYNDYGFSSALGTGATQSFAQQYGQRKRVLYAGGNDGMLHAFEVGVYSGSAYNAGTGDELFGYIPNKTLANLKAMTVTGTSSHPYFVDSAPKAADVWVDSNSNDIKETSEWKTVLIGGLRKGGRGYYALNVSDPADNTVPFPTVMWELTNDDVPKLGETWSEPAIGKVQLDDGAGGTPKDRWVAFVGGGYWCPTLASTVNSGGTSMTLSSVEGFSPTDNVNINLTDLAQFTAVNTTTKVLTMSASGTDTMVSATHSAGECVYGSSVGAGFYVIDIGSGTVLWKLDNTTDGNMMYPVAASPVMVDTNTDSRMDTVYIVDVANQVWRFDLSAVGTYNSVSKTVTSGWSGKRIFKPSSLTTARQPSFNRVEVAFDSALHPWVFFGTGDRERPETIGGSGSTGRIYAFQDTNPSTPITDSDLTNLNAIWTDSIATSRPVTSGAGWYVDLPNADEKSLSDPAVFNNVLYFTTFKSVTDNLCKGGGDARLYGLKLDLAGTGVGLNAGAGGMLNAVGSTVRSLTLQGGGIPSNPVVSMSANGGAALYVGTTNADGTTGGMNIFTINAPSAFKKMRKWKEWITD